MRVSGWAYCPGDAIETVVVLLDGDCVAVAELAVRRPDVGTRFRFAAGSATRRLARARRTGRVASRRRRRSHCGHRRRSRRTPRPDPDHGRASPRAPYRQSHRIPGAERGGVLYGHRRRRMGADAGAVGQSGAPGRRLRRRAGACPLAVPRPDLASFPEPLAPLAGFVHTADLRRHARGDRVRIGGEVVTRGGRRAPTRARRSRRGPRSRLGERPAPRAGAVDAGRRRCAWHRRGSPPSPVRLLVVTHQLGLGGGQLYLTELLRRLLVELDISCLVVYPRTALCGRSSRTSARPSTCVVTIRWRRPVATRPPSRLAGCSRSRRQRGRGQHDGRGSCAICATPLDPGRVGHPRE